MAGAVGAESCALGVEGGAIERVWLEEAGEDAASDEQGRARREDGARRFGRSENRTLQEGNCGSRDEVGGGEGDELAGGDDFGLFPEGREVAGVAGDEVIGAGGVGTFEEDVVGRIGSGLDVAGRGNQVALRGDWV